MAAGHAAVTEEIFMPVTETASSVCEVFASLITDLKEQGLTDKHIRDCVIRLGAYMMRGADDRLEYDAQIAQHKNAYVTMAALMTAALYGQFTGNEELKRLRDYLWPATCEICGWSLAKSADEGCVPGNCSYRPPEGTDEYRRIQKRREDLRKRSGS